LIDPVVFLLQRRKGMLLGVGIGQEDDLHGMGIGKKCRVLVKIQYRSSWKALRKCLPAS
jgi:hypothetical protein